MKTRTKAKRRRGAKWRARRDKRGGVIRHEPGELNAVPATHAVLDLLWEKVHSITGSMGRNNNAAFVECYLEMCERISPQVSFEIGAREANFSRQLKTRCPQTTTYAFEANPYVYEQFREAVSAGILYVNEAISCDSASREFFIPLVFSRPHGLLRLANTNPTSSLKLRKGDGVEYESVICKCDTLDSWHERLGWPTSVLWIDVEGAVGEVIQGAARSLGSCVQCVFVELEKSAGWKDQWLAPHVVGAMNKFGFIALVRDCETPWQYNQIFVREQAVKTEVVDSIKNYMERLFVDSRTAYAERNPEIKAAGEPAFASSQSAFQAVSSEQDSNIATTENIDSCSPQSPLGQYPDRTQQVQ